MTTKNGYVTIGWLVTVALSLTAIFTTLLIFGIREVAAVDLRATEKYNSNRKMIIELLETNLKDHTTIIADVREIKTILSYGRAPNEPLPQLPAHRTPTA